MGSVTRSFKSFFQSPEKIVRSVAKGDVSGAIGGALSLSNLGTIGSGGGFIDTEKYMPSATTLKEQEKAAKQASQAAAEQAKKAAQLEEQEEKRRKSIFFTSGQELGEDIGLVGNLKRRGSILGN